MFLGRDRLLVNAFCAQNDSSSISNKRVKSLIFNGEVSCFHSNLIKGKYITNIFLGIVIRPQKKKRERKRERKVELFFVN